MKFKKVLIPKILGAMLLVGIAGMSISSIPTYAEVNVSTSFGVTYNDKTTNYSPGKTVKIYADAIKDNQYFDGFSYSSEITYPGVSYSDSLKQFVFTFIMPSCDVNIEATYSADPWEITTDGQATTLSDASISSTGTSAYVSNSMLSEDISAYNAKIYPGDNTVYTYSGQTVKVTINGSTASYVKGQPVVLKEKFIRDEKTGAIAIGYMGTDAQTESLIYTGTDGVKYLQTTFINGFDSDVDLATEVVQGSIVTLNDTSGNHFGKEIVKSGDTVQFAIPTKQGEYTVSNIKAIDENGNEVEVDAVSQTNGNTILNIVASSQVINVTFTWHDVEDETPVDAPTVVTTKSNILSSQIKSTGVIESYSASDLLTPAARIDADDIQKNRDEILVLQKALSDTDGSGEGAIYFFHDPTVTYQDGTTETLSGWFIQKGSDVPMANDSWLQVG